ncbi:MAG: hypothetical protein IK095_00335 [Oscillospiraceae bacterium]|nr:hypothetical protein [Oscillospiraceae bacterium]
MVHTHWGWFRLDEGAYRDHLAGKLWIDWKPKSMASSEKEEETLPAQEIPPCVTEEAVRLRDEAARRDVFLFVRERFPGIRAEIPFTSNMQRISVQELPLSVRASNCLMRSGVSTFGSLYETVNSETGLRSIRNLGSKSEEEILHSFFSACYDRLSAGEKAQYWQRMIDERTQNSRI